MYFTPKPVSHHWVRWSGDYNEELESAQEHRGVERGGEDQGVKSPGARDKFGHSERGWEAWGFWHIPQI